MSDAVFVDTSGWASYFDGSWMKTVNISTCVEN
jgi:hypothetical protein